MEQHQNSIFDYLEIIYRRKWVLIAPIILGSGIALFLSFILPAYYRSTTLILVEQQQVPEAYVKSTDTTSVEKRINTINQQIMSRTNLEKIINNFNLYKYDANKESSKNPLSVLQKFLMPLNNKTSAKEDMIDQMRKDIEIRLEGVRQRGAEADAFSISYSSRDPYIAMQVAGTLVSLFIDENLKIREQYAEGTSEFLVSEMNKAKQELETQEIALRRFKEEQVGSLPEQLDANLRTLDRLQMELQIVNDNLKNADGRKGILEGQISNNVIAANPIEAEYARLKTVLSNLLSKYKEDYPDIVITRDRIKNIEEQMKNIKESNASNNVSALSQQIDFQHSNSDIVTVNSQIMALKEREAKIRKQIREYEKRVETTPANEQKLININRDYDISLKNYQDLLNKKLNARLAENLEKRQKGERFRIIDPANLPEKPYKPDRVKIRLIGIMAGLVVGIGLVFLLEFLNPAFRKPEDFAGIINQPILATIPLFSEKSAEKAKKRFKVIQGRKG